MFVVVARDTGERFHWQAIGRRHVGVQQGIDIGLAGIAGLVQGRCPLIGQGLVFGGSVLVLVSHQMSSTS
ncbi:hypothetical protein D3C75_1010480 [compost metagenome]